MADFTFLYTMKLASLNDGRLQKRDKKFEITGVGADVGAGMVDALATAAALKAAILADSNSNCIKETLSYVTASGVIPSAVGNLFREAVATWAITADGTKSATFALPAPKDAILTPTRKEIDPTSATWQTLEALFKAAGKVRLSDGESIRDATPLLASKVRMVGSGQAYSSD